MVEISLYDTLTARKQPLRPTEGRSVGIYVCGPTVYSRVHIGNARPYVVFSLLARFLSATGLDVTLVCNITDVNDKIYAAAAGSDSAGLAREMAAHYVADTNRLGLGRPDHEPLASESIAAIIDEIETLVERGHAYEAAGDVYFRVRSDPDYGGLSGRDIEQMDQGEELEGAERKTDALDFALWKAQKPGEDVAWNSPWGLGRPGWHIECSAMAESLLGVGFEIHGGGIDLAFPHHENEAAQTRCARGRQLAQIWMHNGMLETGSEKMGKSLGNVSALHEVLDAYGRDAVVMYMCGGHYRQPIAFGPTELTQAAASVARVRGIARRLAPGPSPPEMSPLRERFFAALADDFNTPQALAAVFDWIREANRRSDPGSHGAGSTPFSGDPGATVVGNDDLRAMLDILGLANLLDDARPHAPEDVLALASQRRSARTARDWVLADRLRDTIAGLGWSVRDDGDGFELVALDR
ncbi:MAG: cysteinyl-tRNA synthetase [Solirubrobacteraceae bacterium]|nr:cysteinyl-tRNA synthetase [Solirubrobacteraceae bacterium]